MCHPKHIEHLRNIGIINSTTRLHLVGSFYEICITMHGCMNMKCKRLLCCPGAGGGKRITLLEGSHAASSRPSGGSNMKIYKEDGDSSSLE